MDPKLSNLDPKLQDAYNRVMGGSVNSPTTPQQPIQAPPIPPTQPNQPSQNQEQPNNTTPPVYPPPPADPAPEITPPSQFANNPNLNLNPNENPSNNPTHENTQTPPDILSQSTQAPVFSSSLPNQNAQTLTEETPPPSAPADEITSPAPIESTISTAPPQAAMPSSSSTIAFNAENSSKNIGTTPVKKGGLHILPLAIGMGVILLLLAYTFIWIIIFNVELPFLPAF